jgi:F-type H+-transporting ATPase subunit delta
MSPASDIKAEQVAAQLRSFSDAVASSPELQAILASPAVPVVRKRAVVKGVSAKLELGRITQNFLLVLSDHRRAAALSQMIEAFELQLDERLGFKRAEVRSAQELTDPQKNQLATQLAALAGGQVRMRFTLEPELIGGVTARLGSKVYDGSVRGQLAGMRDKLTGGYLPEKQI